MSRPIPLRVSDWFDEIKLAIADVLELNHSEIRPVNRSPTPTCSTWLPWSVSSSGAGS